MTFDFNQLMAEHEEGFVLTTFDSMMNSVRRTVGAKALDIGAPVVNWARKSALVADDFWSGLLRD